MTRDGERQCLVLRRSLVSGLGMFWFGANFFVAIPALLFFVTGGAPTIDAGVRSGLGALLISLGTFVSLILVVRFIREGRGTVVPLDPPERLVTSGLFRWTRNPMYLSYVVTIAGEALLFASWMLAAYAVAFWLLAHLYVIAHEEHAMGQRFGRAYADYGERVPRWILR